MEQLPIRNAITQIFPDKAFRLGKLIHGIHNVIAHINTGVGEAGILPVNEDHVPIGLQHPVGLVGVAMAEALFHAVAQCLRIQLADVFL